MNASRPLYYLGPAGSFTHQAAVQASGPLDEFDASASPCEPTPLETIPEIMHAVQSGRGWGIIAWENNVEGYVVPHLDALIDSRGVAGIARVGIDVQFDAFVVDTPDATVPGVVTAHPHGLAQCQGFIADRGLHAVPSTSNAAACRDLQPGQIALGPSICGTLYGLKTFASQVQDYRGARTEFLVLAPRDDTPRLFDRLRDGDRGQFESIVAFVPLQTGPGVLANLLDRLRDARLNMTSFISRPIKGRDGTYSFIATIDAAPWQRHFRAVLEEIACQGDWVKTLAVYRRRERPNPPVDAWMLPEGGIRVGQATTSDGVRAQESWQHGAQAERELLW